MRQTIIKILPYFIIGVVVFMLGSLQMGWLNNFFFAAEHADVQGIDYFSIPKSYLNLLEGRSAYDTWGGAQYGPHATWYLAHPAFTVFVSFWFSFFTPWTSYWLFVLFSIAIMAYSGYLISTQTNDVLKKRLGYAILLCAFPTYWMLFVGNMHAPLVLALTLIFVSIFEMAYGDNPKSANWKLMAGLLISFFSKPIVLLMLPVLLLTPETRRTTFISLIIYGGVSFLFIVLPLFNPQGIGIARLLELRPDFIKENLNIYKNHLQLNEYMKDNSIHWLNLIAQSDYKLMHIEVFSLPVFMDTLLDRTTPAAIYKLPIYISMLLSCGVIFIRDAKVRLEAILLLLMAISLTFYLSYNTVWEYQFASALPVVALLPSLYERRVFYYRLIPVMLLLGIMFCLPSLYFLVRSGDYSSASAITTIRLDRIIPALLLFILMIAYVIWSVVKYARVGAKETAASHSSLAA